MTNSKIITKAPNTGLHISIPTQILIYNQAGRACVTSLILSFSKCAPETSIGGLYKQSVWIRLILFRDRIEIVIMQRSDKE